MKLWINEIIQWNTFKPQGHHFKFLVHNLITLFARSKILFHGNLIYGCQFSSISLVSWSYKPLHLPFQCKLLNSSLFLSMEVNISWTSVYYILSNRAKYLQLNIAVCSFEWYILYILYTIDLWKINYEISYNESLLLHFYIWSLQFLRI